MFKKFFENRRRKKVLLEKAEKMEGFINEIAKWYPWQGCGCGEPRICCCDSDLNHRWAFEYFRDEAAELIKTLKI